MKEKYFAKYKIIGLNIRYYRKLKGYSQDMLAEKVNKSTAFIGAIEAPNVNKGLSFDTLFDISKELEIEPYKLLKED